MLWILSAALTAAPAEPQGRIAPATQAQATVRIMRAAELRETSLQGPPQASIVRRSSVREADGSTTRASLVEFY